VFTSNSIHGAASVQRSEEAQHDESSTQPQVKRKKGAACKHSVSFLKKVARMPASDRKQILLTLKKQKIKRKLHTVGTKEGGRILYCYMVNQRRWRRMFGEDPTVGEEEKEGHVLSLFLPSFFYFFF
jgi:hypothetical protein